MGDLPAVSIQELFPQAPPGAKSFLQISSNAHYHPNCYLPLGSKCVSAVEAPPGPRPPPNHSWIGAGSRGCLGGEGRWPPLTSGRACHSGCKFLSVPSALSPQSPALPPPAWKGTHRCPSFPRWFVVLPLSLICVWDLLLDVKEDIRAGASVKQ